MTSREAWVRATATTLVVVVLDQVLKHWAIGSVEPGARESLLWFVDLVNVRNSGVAFGAFAGGGALVAVVVVVAMAGLVAFFVRHATQPGAWLAVGLLLGGGLGNIIDRVRIGAVIDYIKIPHWPAFNLADTTITVGVVAIVMAIERELASMALLTVDAEGAGSRLDVFLASSLGSRARAARLISAGHVLANGVAVAKRYTVIAGDVIEIPDEQDEGRSGAREAPLSVPTAFVDDDVLVIDKPAGLVVHPAPGHHELTLTELLEADGADGDLAGRAGLVHRLDRDTSGLLIVARNESAHRVLTDALAARTIEREYVALVVGCPPARTGTIDAPLGRDRRYRTRRSPNTDDPRPAVTHFAIEEQLGPYTLLVVRLETGRTHQIRAHFQAIGFPVAGDPEYGTAGELGLTRQFLHARRLQFSHPRTGEPVEIRSGLPADLSAVLAAVRADDAGS